MKSFAARRVRTLGAHAFFVCFGAMAAAAVVLAPPAGAMHLLVPGNCQPDADGPNDQPGQKDITQYCIGVGDGSPHEFYTISDWDETKLTGNNTADICTLFDTDADGLVNLASCVTLESSGAGNGNLAVFSHLIMYTCTDTKGDRCTGSVAIAGTYASQCEVAQANTDPFSPAVPGGPGDFYPVDTQILCGIDLADFGAAGTGARLLDACSYPSEQPNSDPSDCILYSACTTNADCDDGNPCTIDTCATTSGNICVHTPDAGASCDNGLYCDGTEICSSLGFCEASVPRDCNDGLSCTLDSCDELNDVCINDPRNSLCTDGAYCNGVEVCDPQNGAPVTGCAAGTPPSCDDSVACTADVCNEVTDTCDHTPNNASCNDGDYCNGVETCDLTNGCQAGTAPDCDDGLFCTDDSCNESTNQCDHAVHSCDDGSFCTDDSCNEGTNQCDNTAHSCDDGLFCTDDSCNEGTNQCDNTPHSCDDGLFCTSDSCNESTNQCDNTAVTCDDGLFCTDDACNESTNQCDNTPHICNDGEFCTDDFCDENANACATTPHVCDDGQFCTDDFCDENANACDATPHVCDDGLFCTDDFCDENANTCGTTPHVCNDGLFCTDDTCDENANACVVEPHVCDDTIACTDDSCDEADDECDHVPSNTNCDDGLFCTDDTCSLDVADCVHTPHVCNDGEFCTDDFCDENANTCATTPHVCNDGLFCTDDFCDENANACATTPHVCNDGLFCTDDACNESTNQCDNTPHVCNDGLFCTDDFCDENANACATTPHVCNDGLFCTDDFCDENANACSTTPHACNDGLFCTDDACNESTNQCDNTPHVCNDGLFCTDDFCDENANACATTQHECDDGLFCTNDSCNESANRCDNTAVSCDDGLFCTDDACNETTNQCDNTTRSCDDGLFCTDDACNETTNQCDNTTHSCDDGVACTNDSCNESANACDYAPDDTLCNDGQYCNGVETCNAQIGCEQGFPLTCSDGQDCTTDTCDEVNDTCLHDSSLCPVCGDGKITGAPFGDEECDPPAPAGTFEDCDNNNVDDDGDGKADCRDRDCAPGPTNPPIGRTEPICDEGCKLDDVCKKFIKDPGLIKYSWDETPDRFKIHGRFPYAGELDPLATGMDFRISNSRTPIYGVTLGWGELVGNPRGTRFRYFNRYARDEAFSNRPAAGLERVTLILRLYDGVPYLTFKIVAYGDFSEATEPEMTSQLIVNDGAGSLTAPWIAAPAKWILPNSEY